MSIHFWRFAEIILALISRSLTLYGATAPIHADRTAAHALTKAIVSPLKIRLESAQVRDALPAVF